MQGLQPVDNFQDAVHQDLPPSIVQFAQCPSSPEVGIVVRIATRAFQWALTRDFNRKGGVFPLEDFSPRLQDLQSLHFWWPFLNACNCARCGCVPCFRISLDKLPQRDVARPQRLPVGERAGGASKDLDNKLKSNLSLGILNLASVASSTGRCITIWYKAVFKGGVYDPRETVWAFGGAGVRHVAPLEGGTVVA